VKPKRILFCTLGYEPSPVGGAERQARLQAEELTRRGHIVEVVSPRWRGTRTERVCGIRVNRLPRIDRRPFRTITYLPVLFVWLLVNLRRFDIVHVHLANLQVDIVALAQRPRRVPTFVKVAAGGPRGELARMNRVAWATRYRGIRTADSVQALSSEIERELVAVGVPPGRIVRIPNGLRTDIFRPATSSERRAAREALGLPLDDLIVLWAGRFAQYKGVQDLTAAWAALTPTRPAVLVLVGEPAVDAPIGPLPLLPRMVLKPWTTGIEQYYRAADIYVHPSHADGMPNVVLEAMGCGLAVIATRVAAVPDMIDDQRTGLLVDIGAVEQLRRSIELLISEAGLRRSLGSAAARRVTETYSIARVVDLIEAQYGAIVEARG